MKTLVVAGVNLRSPKLKDFVSRYQTPTALKCETNEKLQAAPIGVVKQLVLCRNLRLFGSSLEPMPNFHDTVYEYGNFCPLAIHYN